MTARILIYSDEQGNPYYLPGSEYPVTMRDVAADIMRNFARRPQDVPLFADHQWGKAFGWVQSLEEREDGLYAIIELTEDGEALVASGAYRYVSPGLQRDIQLPNGEILDGWYLCEVSLTNMPAQYGAAFVQLTRANLQRDEWHANMEPFKLKLDEESSWDKEESEARWRRYVSNKDTEEWGDEEWRRYRQRYLAYNSANPTAFASYKLPVVDIVDGEPRLIKRALSAALAALHGARGGVDLPNSVKQILIDSIQKVLEASTMSREQLLQILNEALTPMQQRLERVEQLLQAHEQHQREQLQREQEEQLEQLILSWRYDNDQVIPPAIARSYAKLLARLPEHERNDALNALRNAPPALVPLSRTAQPATQTLTPPDDLTAKYARQLGVPLETIKKYKEVQ